MQDAGGVCLILHKTDWCYVTLRSDFGHVSRKGRAGHHQMSSADLWLSEAEALSQLPREGIRASKQSQYQHHFMLPRKMEKGTEVIDFIARIFSLFGDVVGIVYDYSNKRGNNRILSVLVFWLYSTVSI